MTIEIPVTNQPNQRFDVNIPRENGNLTLTFFFFWNAIAGYWEMNVSDTATGTGLIAGLALVTGIDPVQNILRQFEYLDIGAAYVTPLTDDAPEYPQVDSWGNNFALVWDIDGELEAAA